MRTAIALLLVLLVACGGPEKPPDAPLDRKKFEQVLMGSLLIEAGAEQGATLDQRNEGAVADRYDEMFRKEGVTQEDFRATYDAYVKQPEQLKAVYQDVLNDLQQRADSASR